MRRKIVLASSVKIISFVTQNEFVGERSLLTLPQRHLGPPEMFHMSPLSDLRGAPGTPPPLPRGPNSFIFMQFSANN